MVHTAIDRPPHAATDDDTTNVVQNKEKLEKSRVEIGSVGLGRGPRTLRNREVTFLFSASSTSLRVTPIPEHQTATHPSKLFSSCSEPIPWPSLTPSCGCNIAAPSHHNLSVHYEGPLLSPSHGFIPLSCSGLPPQLHPTLSFFLIPTPYPLAPTHTTTINNLAA